MYAQLTFNNKLLRLVNLLNNSLFSNILCILLFILFNKVGYVYFTFEDILLDILANFGTL